MTGIIRSPDSEREAVPPAFCEESTASSPIESVWEIFGVKGLQRCWVSVAASEFFCGHGGLFPECRDRC